MHDAPPPPLDRQGIGRLSAGPIFRTDNTLNDACPGGVTPYPGDLLPGSRARRGEV
jgi:hypothetical protein